MSTTVSVYNLDTKEINVFTTDILLDAVVALWIFISALEICRPIN